MGNTKHIPYEATHPGEILKDEIDARPELNQKKLAALMGVKPSFLNEIIKGKRPISADTAILLEGVLDIPADFWLKFQMQFELQQARIKRKNIEKINVLKKLKNEATSAYTDAVKTSSSVQDPDANYGGNKSESK